MAITTAQTVTGTGASVASVSTASWTPAANELILVWIACRQGVTATAVSGNGITFVKVLEDTEAAQGQCTLSLWRGMSASPSAGPITATLSGTALATVIMAHRISGTDPSGSNGSGAIGAAAITNTGATDTTAPSVTLTTTTANSRVYGGATHRNQTYTVGAGETAITLNLTAGTAGDITSISTEFQDVATIGSVTINGTLASATDWIQGAVEIIAAIPTVTGNATLTPGGDTIVGAVAVAVQGGGTLTPGGDTIVGAVAVAVQGGGTLTPGGDTLTAQAGLTGILSDATLTPGGDTIVGAVAVAVQGSGTLTPGGDTIVGAVAVAVQGSGTLTPGGDTIVGAVAVAVQGSGTLQSSANTLTALVRVPLPPVVLADHTTVIRAQIRICVVPSDTRSIDLPKVGHVFEAKRMAVIEINKDPGSTLDYRFNWESYLAAIPSGNDTITGSTWNISGGASLTIDSQSFTTTTTTIRLVGGTIGQKYKVANTITLASGQIEVRRLSVVIMEL